MNLDINSNDVNNIELVESSEHNFEEQPLLNQQAIGILSSSRSKRVGMIEKEESSLLRRQTSSRRVDSDGVEPQNGYMPDLIASLSVAFVNLPMCMAFAAAARLSPTSGIVSAFWSSLFIGFSDSRYSVTSVAMSIALMTGPMVTSYGEDGYHIALFISGLTIMVLLFTRLYKYMIIIPKSVMDGFIAGCVIGVFVEQIPIIFRIEKPQISEEESPLISRLFTGISRVIEERATVNWYSAFLYFFITISLFLLMKKFPSKPWVLFMCIFGIFIGYMEDFFQVSVSFLRLSEEYPNIRLRFFKFPSIGSRDIIKMLSRGQFYSDTLSLTLVIMLDSMITWGMMGVSTDQTYTSKPQNILVVIFMNLSCIVTGSMGSGFVYSRSLLNYQAGAKTQLSCFFNGFICLGIGFLFFSFFSYMPSVVLEAILMGLELKTIRIPELIFTFKNDFKLFLTNITVTGCMLFTRGSNAIFIGLFLYLAMFAKELMIPQNEITFTRREKGDDESQNYLESSSKSFHLTFKLLDSKALKVTIMKSPNTSSTWEKRDRTC